MFLKCNCTKPFLGAYIKYFPLILGTWIDPGLSTVPYHPDYGDGR